MKIRFVGFSSVLVAVALLVVSFGISALSITPARQAFVVPPVDHIRLSAVSFIDAAHGWLADGDTLLSTV